VGFPNWVQYNKTVNIGTDVKDKTVERTTIVDLGDFKMPCTFTEMGRWNCSVDYPGTVNPETDIGRPMTQREYDNLVSSTNETAKRLQTDLRYANGLILLETIFIIIIIVGVVLFYLIVVRGWSPYIGG